MDRYFSLLTMLALTFAIAITGLAPARAQNLLAAAERAPDLRFPTETSQHFKPPRMALFKPTGPGPFPALLLFHQCGGLGGERWQNQSMMDWAVKAVNRGYVALVIDALGPRDVVSVCFGPQKDVTFARGVRDALQGAAYLRRLPYVDGERVAMAGYSWGAMVALLASSYGWGETLKDGGRFTAAAAFYPGCLTIRPSSSANYEIMRHDIDRPLLVLMGGEDTETPAVECLDRLNLLKASRAPVDWHLYPEATHCWDCSSLDGHSKVDARGNRVFYRYDPVITRDSEERLFGFLQKQMPGR